MFLSVQPIKFPIRSYVTRKKIEKMMNSSKLYYWKYEEKTFFNLICLNEVSSCCSNCWTSFKLKPSSCSPIRCLKFEKSEVVGCIYHFVFSFFFFPIQPLGFLNRFDLGLELVISIAPIISLEKNSLPRWTQNGRKWVS
jgi:hypothetical protein